MPPKRASTSGPPRRSSRTATRNSINSNSNIPVSCPLPSASSSSSIVNPQQLTATSKATAASQRILTKDSSNSQNVPQEPTQTTKSVSPTQPRNPEKTLAADLGTVIGDAICVKNNVETVKSVETEQTGIEHIRPDKTNQREAETVVGRGNGAKEEIILSSMPVLRPHVKDETLAEPVARSDSGASGVAGPGNGKRKIVRKTVRVVKKVIKKRVPKRVLTSGPQNQELLEKAENGEDSSKVIESSCIPNNLIIKSDHEDETTEITSHVNEGKETSEEILESTNLAKDVIENSNLVHEVTKKPSHLNEVAEKSSVADEVKETLKIDNDAHVSESLIGGNVNDLNGIDGTKMETSSNNSCPRVSEPIISEKGNDHFGIDSEEMGTSNSNNIGIGAQMIGDQSGICSTEMDTMNTNGFRTEVERKGLNACVPDSVEVEKVNFASETHMQNESTMEVENSVLETVSKDLCLENQGIDVVDKEDVGPGTGHSVGPAEEKSVVYVERARSPINEISDSKERDNVELNEELLLSGEIGVLERKKRRQTEIFVGGLDKDTKEDDIRRVFEKAGAIVEVRLVRNNMTGKGKGFAFVRFATAADAKNVLAKFSTVEICGKQCGTSPVVGNDTLFLGSIDRNWKNEDVVQLLEKAGIERIDKVTLKPDPNNIEKNRGFAFVEFETSRDAQVAFHKLEKKNILGKNLKIKVSWAEPLREPSEEEISKAKSVYAEYLPLSWDEGKVKEYFKRFGEIESVVLSKDLPLSKRKDFAFIHYQNREAALRCIESVSRERLQDSSSKVRISVSLAKPSSKSKQLRHASDPTGKQPFKEKSKASQASIKLHEPSTMGKLGGSRHDHARIDTRFSTTDELVRILRQQASTDQIPHRPSLGASIPEHHFPLPGSKRPFSHVGPDPAYLDPRPLPRARIESYTLSGPSAMSHGVGMPSFSYRHQQGPGSASGTRPEPVNRRDIYPSHFQSREQAPYHGNSSVYRRY